MARFRYYNRNGDPTLHRNDCVTRAISLASGMSYEDTRRKLYHTAKLLDCNRICMSCYKFLIEDVLCAKPLDCDGLTVEEFADIHPKGIYLVRMNGHISTIIDNTIYDIFDCRDYQLTNAWRVFTT